MRGQFCSEPFVALLVAVVLLCAVGVPVLEQSKVAGAECFARFGNDSGFEDGECLNATRAGVEHDRLVNDTLKAVGGLLG